MRANTQNVQKGEQETRGVGEGRTKHSGEQRHEEMCGRDGVGNTGYTTWTPQGPSGPYAAWTFRKESREFEGGFGVD